MALTQNPWTFINSADGKFMIATCTTACDTTLLDEYTLKTPKELDTRRPYTLTVSHAATKDAQAIPLDIWVGWTDDFVITGNNTTVGSTSGAKYKRLTDDCVEAVTTLKRTFLIDPDFAGTEVVAVANVANGYKIRGCPAPYHAYHLDGGSALSADLTTWVIIQAKK